MQGPGYCDAAVENRLLYPGLLHLVRQSGVGSVVSVLARLPGVA